MKYIDEKFLYQDEKVLNEMVFTNIPLIILWVCAAIVAVSLIIVGVASNTLDTIIMMILIDIVFLAICVIITITYTSREFVVTDKRILYAYGLFNHKYLDIPLNKIQMIKCGQTIWQRRFKYGSILISTSVFGILGHRWFGITNFKTIKTTVMCAIDLYENTKSIKVIEQPNTATDIAISD